MAIILLESILLALGGGAIGLVLGHSLTAILAPVIAANTHVSVNALQFQGSELILIPGLIALASLVGYLPAVIAYRTDVAQSLILVAMSTEPEPLLETPLSPDEPLQPPLSAEPVQEVPSLDRARRTNRAAVPRHPRFCGRVPDSRGAFDPVPAPRIAGIDPHCRDRVRAVGDEMHFDAIRRRSRGLVLPVGECGCRLGSGSSVRVG